MISQNDHSSNLFQDINPYIDVNHLSPFSLFLDYFFCLKTNIILSSENYLSSRISLRIPLEYLSEWVEFVTIFLFFLIAPQREYFYRYEKTKTLMR